MNVTRSISYVTIDSGNVKSRQAVTTKLLGKQGMQTQIKSTIELWRKVIKFVVKDLVSVKLAENK
jgi:hypothetical protein